MSILPASSIGDESTGFYSFEHDQSLNFNDGDNPELNFTPADTDRQKFTMSVWIKRGIINSAMRIFGGETNNGLGNQFTFFGLDSSNRFRFDRLQDGTTNTVISPANLRDNTNWYHLVGAVDTTQSTEANRVRLYINGVEQTLIESSSGFPTQNLNTMINISSQSTRHIIGHTGYNNSLNFDGYMSDFNFIDGSQLGPSSFGETKNGVWIPKDTSGLTFGTNGVRLTFADSSSLGDDTSGNGNDFSSAGLASTDVVKDTPTNNFAVGFGSIAESDDYQGYDAPTSSEGNRKLTASGAAWNNGGSSFGMTSGKWYAECIVNSWQASNYVRIGLRAKPARTYDEYFVLGNGTGQLDAAARNGRLPSFTTGDVIQFALDLENQAFYLGKNGTWGNSATEAEIEAGTTTNAFASGSEVPLNDGHAYFFYAQPHTSTTTITWNFGADSSFAGAKTAQGNSDSGSSTTDFYYTPPDGFLACNAANLADVTIGPASATQADDHFNTVLYTGNGSTTQNINIGFNPDWVWIKSRSSSSGHHSLIDSSRGDVALNSNQTIAEYSVSEFNFKTDNTIDVPYYANDYSMNTNTATYVAWNWKANGGTTSSNTDGSITSTVQANTTAGFSIVTYTGEGDSQATVGHGLGAVPKVIIPKNRGATGSWHSYHAEIDASAPEDYGILLNATNDRANDAGYFNDTAPTSSVFTVGTYNNFANNYVAYVFAEVEGYSKFGRYDGLSNANGTVVFTGFRPAMVIFKRLGSDSWVIADNKRDPDNQVNAQLFPDVTTVESSANAICDFLSNGFKLRRSAGSINQDGSDYIYFAWAEQPFKFSNAR